jgi:hypothetical protein
LPVHSQDHKNCLEQPRFRCNRRLSAPCPARDLSAKT